MTLTPAYHIADKLGIPAIMTSATPNMSPTQCLSINRRAQLTLGRLGNRLSYTLYRLSWIGAHRQISHWCQDTLQMQPPHRFLDYRFRMNRPVPVLYSYSKLVLPSPPDWNARTLASGYWRLPSNGYHPPESLRDFLANGPPPVFVGFGSTVSNNPERFDRIGDVCAGHRVRARHPCWRMGWLVP
jgi:sterol 3beta-glucosyltransferase